MEIWERERSARENRLWSESRQGWETGWDVWRERKLARKCEKVIGLNTSMKEPKKKKKKIQKRLEAEEWKQNIKAENETLSVKNGNKINRWLIWHVKRVYHTRHSKAWRRDSEIYRRTPSAHGPWMLLGWWGAKSKFRISLSFDFHNLVNVMVKAWNLQDQL